MTDIHETGSEQEHAADPDAVPTASTSTAVDDTIDAGSTVRTTPFRTISMIAGAALTLLVPVLAVIVGVVMIGGERDRTRRLWLRNWIIGSLIWLAIGGFALVAALSGGGGPSGTNNGGPDGGCRGSVVEDIEVTTYQSDDGKNWTATYPCSEGGSKTVHIPASEVPGGGK